MNPAALIAALDRALDEAGATVTLRRIAESGNADVDVRAAGRGLQATELVQGMSQTRVKLVISPSPIAAAGWPVGEVSTPSVPVPSLPRRNDKIIYGSRIHNVDLVRPFYVADQLVRIELEVEG